MAAIVTVSADIITLLVPRSPESSSVNMKNKYLYSSDPSGDVRTVFMLEVGIQTAQELICSPLVLIQMLFLCS